MTIVHCRNCGSGVLGTEGPERCNNCDPLIQRALAEAAAGDPREENEPPPCYLIVIPVDRQPELHLTGSLPSWSEMRKLVGGHIEIARIDHIATDLILLVNEEGKVRGLPLNPVATACLADFDGIAGPAVVCRDGIVDSESDCLHLSEEMARHLHAQLMDIYRRLWGIT